MFHSIDSPMVRINRFQRLGPGSIPGQCIFVLFFELFFCFWFYYYSLMRAEGRKIIEDNS